MEEDAVMEDGNESEYPEPTSETRGPYPSLLQELDRSPVTPSPLYASEESIQYDRPRSRRSINSLAPLEPKSTAQPWTSDSFARNAIPAHSEDVLDIHHNLADSERLNNDFINNQEANTPDAVDGSAVGSRGRGRGRGRGGIGSRGGSRRRGWRWALRGTDHADIFSKPKPVGGNRGKKRGRRSVGRPRTSVNATGVNWIDPGAEFTELQRKATAAWLDGKLETALEYAKMAVQKNSEVFMTHKMISDIYALLHKDRESVVALWSGVNTKRDAGLWADLGEKVVALKDRRVMDDEWAKDCFSAAIKIDKDCHAARTAKLKLHEKLGEWDQARQEGRAIISKWPDDLEYVRKFGALCIRSSNYYDWDRAKEVFERAFEAYAGLDQLGDNVDDQWFCLNDYIDILLRLGYYQKGVTQLKRLARWFLGRKEDAFWDEVPDDREFDSTNERRIHLSQFQQGRISLDPAQYGDGLLLELRVKLGLCRLRMGARDEAVRHFQRLLEDDVEVTGFEELFLEVAESLKNGGLFAEALKFFEPLKAVHLGSSQRYWLSIAQCYNAIGHNDDAEECYLRVVQADKYDIESRIQLARMYDATGQQEKSFKMAEEVTALGRVPRPPPPAAPYVARVLPAIQPRITSTTSAETVQKVQIERQPIQSAPVQSRPTQVKPTQSKPVPSKPVQRNTRLLLPSLKLGQRQQAARAANGRFGSQGLTPQSKTPQLNAPRRLSVSSQDLRARIQREHAAARELQPLLDANDTEAWQSWIEHSSALAAEFQAIQDFVASPETQQKPVRPSHLPQALEQEMQGLMKKATAESDETDSSGVIPAAPEPISLEVFEIAAAEWHQIFSDLALQHAKRADQEKCYDILQNCLMKPTMFKKDPQLVNATQAVCLCCALQFNDSKMMTDVAHEYVFWGQKRSGMALQLLAATGRLSYGEAYFYDKKTTRWIQDMVNTQDEEFKRAVERRRLGPNQAADSPTPVANDFGIAEDGPNPGLLTACAHNTLYHNHTNARPALPLLLRAFALQPKNLVINLSIATTCITNAMRNNSINRTHDIAQGQSFFYRYYNLRKASGKACDAQEAEYNLARMWHQLGLVSDAKPAYERVLEMSKIVQEELAAEEQHEDGEEYDQEEFSREAAFALQQIHLADGDEAAARAIGEEWLAL